jgi:DUF4097 and DUF4098 domain-containing protein YvlB
MKLRLWLIGALALATAIPIGAPADEISGTLPLKLVAGGNLRVNDVNGDVRVEPGSTFGVRYRKHGSGDLGAVRVVGEQTAGGVVVCVRYDETNTCSGSTHHEGGDNVSVDFTITVPAGTRVDAGTVNGNIDVRSDGLVSARTVNGGLDVDAADIDEAQTVNGSIGIRLRDMHSRGSLRAKTVNGSIVVHVPASTGVSVHASVLNGDIGIERLSVKRPEYGPGASVDGTLGDGRRSVDLKTVNGDIHLERAG